MNAQRLIGLMATLFFISLLVGIASAATLDEIARSPQVKEHVDLIKRMEGVTDDWAGVAAQVRDSLEEELYIWAYRSLDSTQQQSLMRLSEKARRIFVLGVLTGSAQSTCSRQMLQSIFD